MRVGKEKLGEIVFTTTKDRRLKTWRAHDVRLKLDIIILQRKGYFHGVAHTPLTRRELLLALEWEARMLKRAPHSQIDASSLEAVELWLQDLLTQPDC